MGRLLLVDVFPTQIEKRSFRKDGQDINFTVLTVLIDGKTSDFTVDRDFNLEKIRLMEKVSFECSLNERKMKIKDYFNGKVVEEPKVQAKEVPTQKREPVPN